MINEWFIRGGFLLIGMIIGSAITFYILERKRGNQINLGKLVLSVIVSTLFFSSIGKELFFNGEETSLYLYMLFGLVQGSAFGMGVPEIIKLFKK